MTERGKYIVIEGSDGTGKSVQSIETTRRLAGLGYNMLLVWNDETGQMEPVQEPGGTPEADKIRKKIKDMLTCRFYGGKYIVSNLLI